MQSKKSGLPYNKTLASHLKRVRTLPMKISMVCVCIELTCCHTSNP